MKTKIIFMLVVILAAVMLTACINPFLPVYEMTDEDGTSVYIDEVRYKQLPYLKWDTELPGRMIGYAGRRDLAVLAVKEDTEMNFIYVHYILADYYERPLYRTDKVIPEPDADSIDKVCYDEYMIENDEEYTNEVEDKEIIDELFNILNSNKKVDDFHNINKGSQRMVMHIYCFSSDLPGAYYYLYVGLNNGKFVCGGRNDNDYVVIPTDLLEKIAGKQIDVNEFTEVD